MAQTKKLTRRQKILMASIRDGKSGKNTKPEDTEALVRHGLIQRNHYLGWEPTEKGRVFT